MTKEKNNFLSSIPSSAEEGLPPTGAEGGEPGHRYFFIHKPFGMVSQFVSPHGVRLLGELNFTFPPGIHAVGRLDRNSEGLLVLTTDKRVTKLLFESGVPHKRTYLVQVKGCMSEESLAQLKDGVVFRTGSSTWYRAAPCEAGIIERPSGFAPGATEIPAAYPHSWLRITLTEGKYHQVRKMVGVLKHPCRRLIRTGIEDLLLGDLPPGGVKEIKAEAFFRLLKIEAGKK